jgi:crotonobetainyl-CoA:carnitine CoA-transferase CaiB-like acyl-CoA transferase
VQGPPAHAGQHTEAVLADAGFTTDEIAKLRETGAVK